MVQTNHVDFRDYSVHTPLINFRGLKKMRNLCMSMYVTVAERCWTAGTLGSQVRNLLLWGCQRLSIFRFPVLRRGFAISQTAFQTSLLNVETIHSFINIYKTEQTRGEGGRIRYNSRSVMLLWWPSPILYFSMLIYYFKRSIQCKRTKWIFQNIN